jgi:Fic family protein
MAIDQMAEALAAARRRLLSSDRLVIALGQSLFQGVDRASYVAEAEVSSPTASNDLRRLLGAGLVAQHGKGRATRYVASESLREGLASNL